MTDIITITGFVATTPRHLITAEGLAVTSFRLASNLRKFDRQKKSWVDAGTNWYSVSTYRHLATNAIGSVQKGDRVLVTGRLRIREWADGEKRGVNIDLDADALGHDLNWGKAAFTRSIQSLEVEAIDERFPVADDSQSDGHDAEGSEDGVAESTRELEQATPF